MSQSGLRQRFHLNVSALGPDGAKAYFIHPDVRERVDEMVRLASLALRSNPSATEQGVVDWLTLYCTAALNGHTPLQIALYYPDEYRELVTDMRRAYDDLHSVLRPL